MTTRVWIADVPGRNLQLRWIDKEGKEQRRSAGTKDAKVAESRREELAAKLLLGRSVDPPKKAVAPHDCGPEMSVELFVEEYDRMYLSTLRPGSRSDALSRLKLCINLARPRTLGDLAKRATLERIQLDLRSGRSPWSVKTTFAALLASLRWAERRDWIDKVPLIDRIKTARLRAMKGRPLATEEFESILGKTAAIVGERQAESWTFLLRGYWESGFRRDELLAMSWDDENQICPAWDRGRFPVLLLPSSMQKSDAEEEIPMLPGLESLLLEVPADQRSGWIFSPMHLDTLMPRRYGLRRLSGTWVSRIISRISKRANIVTHSRGKVHYATCHDFRRSCAQRLLLAGVPREIIKAVLRHRSWETTERHYAPGSVQKLAADVRSILSDQVRVPDSTDHQNQRKALLR